MIEKERGVLEEKINELTASLSSSEESARQKALLNQELELEKQTLSSQLDMRSDENDRMAEDLKKQGEQITSLQSQYSGISTQFVTLEQEQIPLRFEVEKLRGERGVVEERLGGEDRAASHSQEGGLLQTNRFGV